MNSVETNIKLNKEYIISKISGVWSFRKKMTKLGIESYKKIIFLKAGSGYYTFKVENEKSTKKLPAFFLNYIQLIESSEPSVKEKVRQAVSDIRVDVFRTDITKDSNVFENKEIYNHNGYSLKIKYLPAVSTIYGDNYDNKKLRNNILTDFPDIFLGIIDYENLESDLYLVTQFIDMDAKIVLALRNYNPGLDDIKKIDFELLGKLLGIPIVNYTELENIEELDDFHNPYREDVLNTLIKTYSEPEKFVRKVSVGYGRQIEAKISKIEHHLKQKLGNDFYISPRYFAINLLEKDILAVKAHEGCSGCSRSKCIANKEIKSLEKKYGQHIFSILKDARKAYVKGAVTKITSDNELVKRTGKADKLLLHKVWGIPIFLLFMTFAFYATFELGKYPEQWLANGIGLLTNYLDNIMEAGFLKSMTIDGIIKGVGAVLVFLPNILILFLFIGILENTGYLSRIMFLVDKYMRKLGLCGKSFAPMIMGFGCAIPAMLSTRTIESKRGRILTMMIIPFMSCSARFPVYILMISAFFPKYSALVLLGIYLFGILLALLISKIFSKTILREKGAPYIIELSSYHSPKLRLLLSYVWGRGKEYLKNIGGIILVGSVVIWLLTYFPRNVEYSKDYNKLISEAKTEENKKSLESEKTVERYEKSYIGRVGHFMEPVMEPLGFDWKMNAAVLAGIAGKELTVSTMAMLYATDTDKNECRCNSLQKKLKTETYSSGTKIGKNVYNKVVALSFMVFVLIYLPCIAVVSVVWKESSKFKWALFFVIYSSILAWLASFAVYQISSFIIV